MARTQSFFARFIYFGCASRAPPIFSNWILCVALIRVPRQLFPRYAAESWLKARHWMLCMCNANWMNPQQRWMEKKWRIFFCVRHSIIFEMKQLFPSRFQSDIMLLYPTSWKHVFFFFCKGIQMFTLCSFSRSVARALILCAILPLLRYSVSIMCEPFSYKPQILSLLKTFGVDVLVELWITHRIWTLAVDSAWAHTE